jgi:4-hydroxyphenylpyruvate dioxygenase
MNNHPQWRTPHAQFFHHIELQSHDARLLASTLSKILGMRVVAALSTEQGISYCLQSQQAVIVCTSHVKEKRALSDINAQSEFHSGITRTDGISVRAIGMSVIDIAATRKYLSDVLQDEKSEVMRVMEHGIIDVSMPQTTGRIGLRFVASERCPVANSPSGMPRGIPGFELSPEALTPAPSVPGGIIGIDHIAINVKSVPSICERLIQVTGWTFFRAFDESILRRPLNAITLQSQTAEGLLTIVQPTSASSIFDHTLRANGGTCVHHIALRCENILQFADFMFTRGLWETMPAPSPEYYREIRPIALDFVDDGEFRKLQRYGMLLDFENDCALIQVFLPYLGDVPGVFFELIGRVPRRGARLEGPPAPGCGGFGDRNVTELYDCLVRAVDQWPGGRVSPTNG